MKGTFVLCNKPDADGRRMIYYRYYVYGSPLKRSTNIKVLPSEWDAAQQRITTPGAEHLNRRLRRLGTVADGALPQKASPVQVREMFEHVFNRELYRAQNEDFVRYAYEVNLRRYDSGEIGKETYNENIGRIGVLERYLGQCKGLHFLSLEDVDENFLEEFIASLKKEPEVIYKGLTPLVAALEAADGEGLIEHSVLAPVKALHIGLLNRRAKKAAREGISDGEMERIFDYAGRLCEGGTRDALDVFLFSYYACGLRLGDIMLLRWEDVDGATLQKPRYKTSRAQRLSLPLCAAALEILDRWRGRRGKFIFGLVSEDANPDDALGMKRLRGHKGAAISRIVTICAGEIGIKGRLTMETARKSFALRALQSGLPLPALSRILGHGSTGSTVAYLGLDDRFTESEVLKIYNH